MGTLAVVATVGALALCVLALGQRRQIARLRARLSEASGLDTLTGLLDRRAFEELLNAELDRSRRTARPAAVIVGELDGVGRVNAESGHAAGDAALQLVARDLVKWSRRMDWVGRLGGEKFGVLLPETDEHGAFLVAERLRRAARRTFAQQGLPLTISFGVASYPDHGEHFGALMGAAVRAVNGARELGRDRSVIYCAEVARMLEEASEPEVPTLSRLIALAEEIDIRDTGTAGHCHAVGRYAELMANELGFEAEHVQRVRIAGVLHDVGKTGVSDRIASTPKTGDGGDWRTIRTHPEMGARLLAHPEVDDLRGWVLAHHERPDGLGFPRGLMGHEIPVEAHILAVADAYETLSGEAAAAQLRAGAGTQFDARVVEAFLGALERADYESALPQAS